MTLSGGKAFRKVSKVRWGPTSEGWLPFKTGTSARGMHKEAVEEPV